MSEPITVNATAVTLPLDEIKPYPNNPRRITKQAIEAVMHSIREYGYKQPIVVDRNHEIIVGHTRLEALKRLGWTEALVYVAELTEEQAREYRLVDNRTGEMTSWDHQALVLELREFEQGLLDGFFPEVDLQIDEETFRSVTDSDILTAEEKISRVAERDPLTAHTTVVVCPACYGEFTVRTKALPGLSWDELESLVNGSTQ